MVNIRHNYSLRTLSSSMFCMPASKSAASAVPVQPGRGRFGEEAYSEGQMKNKCLVLSIFQLGFTTTKDFVVPTYFVFHFSYFFPFPCLSFLFLVCIYHRVCWRLHLWVLHLLHRLRKSQHLQHRLKPDKVTKNHVLLLLVLKLRGKLQLVYLFSNFLIGLSPINNV